MRLLELIFLCFVIFNAFAIKISTFSDRFLVSQHSEFGSNKNYFKNDSTKDSDLKNINLNMKRVSDVISYGLDSQVIEIINSLKKSGDGEYNDLLEKRLQKTFNIVLKRSILDLFLSLKYSGGVDTANYILDNYESNKYPNELIN